MIKRGVRKIFGTGMNYIGGTFSMRWLRLRTKSTKCKYVALVATLITAILLRPVLSQTQPSIEILDIQPDLLIKGTVKGLSPGEYEKYKVVVYVKTDKWYIHPYERGGPGRSYAVIKKDGTWTIRTVRRELLADYVVALLVGADCEVPSTLHSLGTLDFIAIDQEEGKDRL